jgi:hypothetical protein
MKSMTVNLGEATLRETELSRANRYGSRTVLTRVE